ncbi:MAG: hypothetical protein JWQ76_5669 [Ramlibacter sp.]|nr:hypothetical protein [Ramlibacter sp.]
MQQPLSQACDPLQYELRYASLFVQGRGYAFPCDETGRVDVNRLSPRSRRNYSHARAALGNELGWPVVVRVSPGDSYLIPTG